MNTAASVLAAGLAVTLAAGCANRAPPPLYSWGTFPKLQYETLQLHGSSPTGQMAVLEAQAEKARASGAALPPGFRAHLGMLKLDAGQPDEARALWEAEKLAFPEWAPYMDQLLKRFAPGPATPPT